MTVHKVVRCVMSRLVVMFRGDGDGKTFAGVFLQIVVKLQRSFHAFSLALSPCRQTICY